MISFIRKYSVVISILLLPVLLVLFWLFPGSSLLLGIIFLVLTFAVAGSIVLEKNQQTYKQADVPKKTFIRGMILEIFGILFAMILAGLLARYISEIVTRPIDNDLTRFLGGLVIGLMVGVGVGILVRRAWGMLQNSA